MVSMDLNGIDRKLLNLLQVEFPLTREPFADLGLQLGIEADEVLHRIGQLEAEGIIRQVSPIVDGRKLGYQSTLAAMRVAESRLDEAVKVIIEHPGVSHAYERNHHFNFWFTLAIPPGADIDTELRRLTTPIGAEAVFALPALKLFKLRVFFNMDEDEGTAAASEAPPGKTLPGEVELSRTERAVINELQQDLPLIPRPFTAMSARLGLEVEDFLAQCQSLKQRGIIRRFAAALNHRKAGFTANAMTCLVAPVEAVDIAGQKLAALGEVSHCYQRKTNPLWPYNLFAMIHGHSREMCQEIADKTSRETGLTDYVLLFSTKEFKKTRVKYLL
ncbi:MAG: Lrp/AsnC family transcriptional regulator [Chloroflexi bacterium]|nr:Lrp/AsnC family transcriptional regulator [Chloroflexota bacterium]MBI3930725.1 Lrp/AsnC family transcriptional regulator [Chloroflexota bacterium]